LPKSPLHRIRAIMSKYRLYLLGYNYGITTGILSILAVASNLALTLKIETTTI